MGKGTVALLAVAVVGAGWLGWRQFGPQPAVEPGRPIVEVRLPAALTPEQEAGKVAYETWCAKCHGADGAGQEGKAPPFVHRIYEPSHHGDAAFFIAAQQGVRAHHWPYGNMPPVEGVSEAEVATIVAYIRAIQRANGVE